MSLSVLAWLCLAAYALHALEEFQMDWRDWAQDILKLPVSGQTSMSPMPPCLCLAPCRRRWHRPCLPFRWFLRP